MYNQQAISNVLFQFSRGSENRDLRIQWEFVLKRLELAKYVDFGSKSAINSEKLQAWVWSRFNGATGREG
jgi:hypothetical protein